MMKAFTVFVGLVALATANPIASDEISGDSMIPIDPSMAEQFSSVSFSLKYGEVNHYEVPAAQRFDPISAQIVGALEELRGPLDPIFIPAVGPISFRQIGVISGTFKAQNLLVIGLRNFIIQNMSFSFIGLTLRFDVRVPRIDVSAEYQLDSQILIFFPYNPRGAARVLVLNAGVSGFAGLGQGPDGFLQLSSFELNFDFSNVAANIDGVISNGIMNATLIFLLNLLGPGFLQGQIENISVLVTAEIYAIVNEIIGQYRLADLLG